MVPAGRRTRRGGVNATLLGVVVALVVHGGLLAEEQFSGRLNLFGLNGHRGKAPPAEVEVDYVPEYQLEASPDDPEAMAEEAAAAARVRAELKQAGIAEAEASTPEAPTPDATKPEDKKPEDAAEAEAQPPEPVAANMKAVQLPEDTKAEDTAPADAEYLSDRNSNPAEQTRAEDTNLKRESKGEQPPSAENPEASKDDPIGGPEEQIAGTQEITPDDLMMKGDGEQASKNPAEVPEKAASATPQGSDQGDGKTVGDLAMGDPSVPGKVNDLQPGGAEPSTTGEDAGQGGKGARGNKRGVKGLKLQIGDKDYDKLYGATADRERKVGPQKPSFRQGRFGGKWAMYKQSIENFVPEVKPGNQTALKTRAHPFAVYIAQMHNQIHEHWGFGFLVEAGDHKEYDDESLETTLEIVVLGDGTLEKAPTIVRGSGKLAFDIAAMDSVMSASPFGPPPKAIRSANGKTYLHWDFHRDARECMTAFVRPYILTTPPDANEVDAASGTPKPDDDLPSPKVLARGKDVARARVPVKTQTGAGDETTDGDAKAAAEGASELPDASDPRAKQLVDRFVAALAKRDVGKLLALSASPLRARGGDVPDPAVAYKALVAEQGAAALLVPQRVVLTAGGARKQLGGLPPGEGADARVLFGLVRLKGQMLVLTLARTESGGFVVAALNLK